MSVTLGETIRVEARTRWDALDLARRLATRHAYLVQVGDARWDVCVRTEAPDELLDGVLQAAESWAAERRLESVLRVGGREIELNA